MAGSLIKVDEFTVSSPVASIILGGGSSGSSGANVSIDSTYNVYILQYNNAFMGTDGARIRVRFTVSGSPDISANYQGARLDMYANQAFYPATINGTYLNGFSLGTTTSESSKGTYHLFNFPNSNEYSFVTIELQETNNAGENAGLMGGAALKVVQATDGVQFFASTGNIASGTFTLYGLKK